VTPESTNISYTPTPEFPTSTPKYSTYRPTHSANPEGPTSEQLLLLKVSPTSHRTLKNQTAIGKALDFAVELTNSKGLRRKVVLSESTNIAIKQFSEIKTELE